MHDPTGQIAIFAPAMLAAVAVDAVLITIATVAVAWLVYSAATIEHPARPADEGPKVARPEDDPGLQPRSPNQPRPVPAPVPQPQPHPQPGDSDCEPDARVSHGSITTSDLYAIGRAGGHPFGRPHDFQTVDGIVCAEADPESGTAAGLSTWRSRQALESRGLTGKVWVLPAGTWLPGFVQVDDGVDVMPGSTHAEGHTSIVPTEAMSYAESQARLQNLNWQDDGRIR